MTALLAISCEKSELQMSVEDGQSQKPSLVNVLTRSVGGNPLDYPVSVYAFAPDGSLSDSQIITSEGSSLSLNLSSGQNYHLTAISATGEDCLVYDFSDKDCSYFKIANVSGYAVYLDSITIEYK